MMSGMNLFSQENSQLKFIFIPHLRSDNQVNQRVIPTIGEIDFSKYVVKMLGGDITWSTSKNRATLTYCDSLFDLKSPNTLWSFGNHDVESGNRALIKEFTGRDSFYAYTRDGVTFIVLDTELDANGFNRTFIKGDQLQLVNNVCDTIANSKFLILLHSRYMWMINNDYFKTRLTDSIAASSRSMDTTNFYSDIYPLLQKVKARGIQVKVFGGDKSKINVTYTPEDSITFYAARMTPEFSDSTNNVIVVSYNLQNYAMTCKYVTLADIDKKNQDSLTTIHTLTNEYLLKVWQVTCSKEASAQLQSGNNENVLLQIYSIRGELCQSIRCKANETQTLRLKTPGIYVAKAFIGNKVQARKFVFQ